MTNKARVVVLGGGTAGRSVARRLQAGREHECRIDVVDACPVHVRTPFLAGLASGASPWQAIASGHSFGTVHLARVVGVDPASKIVHAAATATGREHEIPYDHLVVTLGATNEDLGVPGVRDHALLLRSSGDALAICDKAFADLAAADVEDDPEVRAALTTVVVCGGGFAGIGLAGALAERLQAAARAAGSIHPGDVRVVLVDKKPRLLGGLPDRVASAVEGELALRGVEVVTGAAVSAVLPDGVTLKDGRTVPAGLCVWTAGVRASAVVETGFPGAEHSTGGRLVTNPMLQVRGVDDVWAAGDSAAVPDLDVGGECPALGTFALAQARTLARNIGAVVSGDYPRSFRGTPRGSFVPVGARAAVGSTTGRPDRVIHGSAGWLAWCLSLGGAACAARTLLPSSPGQIPSAVSTPLVSPRAGEASVAFARKIRRDPGARLQTLAQLTRVWVYAGCGVG